MNGGKDIKFGDDKRQVSIVPSDEQILYNVSNGSILIDEFGNPLITEVDTYYLPDASKDRSTSVVFCSEDSNYNASEYSRVGFATASYSYSGSRKNELYFNTLVGLGLTVGDFIVGKDIPDGTFVSKIVDNNRILLSNNLTNAGPQSSVIELRRKVNLSKKSNVTWKIAEQFKETSEVSTTLLGVNRAETQLSLFSNVSSYGLDPDEFEFYSYNSGTSFNSWENRKNKIYGSHSLASLSEETQESAIRIFAYPVSHSFPFGKKFEKLGLYNQILYQQYINFIKLGNDLYDYFNIGGGSNYPSDWKNNFLSKDSAYVSSENDVIYSSGIDNAFAKIDTWTDTWRSMLPGEKIKIIDPITNLPFDFASLNQIDGIKEKNYRSDNTRPGYSDSEQRYSYLQSRRVFRYQPGRISGFTFGVKPSIQDREDIILEWGIANPTDQYVFRVTGGNLYIVRRSTIALEKSVLERNKLTLTDQKITTSDDPYDSTEYYTILIPTDKFNGDSLQGNGPSGYLLQLQNVTMYKIEFGWYGAIGARFYAYIPTSNGDARWVVLHTLVIENSLGRPCLQDSYFRFKYSLNIKNTASLRTPQFLYKYGASYYIDGGDEGTSQIYSATSKQVGINTISTKSILGIYPKNYLLNRIGTEIKNKKLIIPTDVNISSDSLAEIKIVTCSACPGFGHVYTPGVATTESGRYLDISFTDQNTISALNGYFTKNDIGSKIIAPSLYNLYITDVDGLEIGGYSKAKIQGFASVSGFSLANRNIAGTNSLVYDRALGITTTVGITTYPHQIRLSNYDAYAVCDFPFTGSKIEIQFVNPVNSDDYAHFADFLIGVTNRKPDVSIPNTLNGFVIGAATTTILPNSDILYGTHTHSYAYTNEDGVETGEGYGPILIKMGIDPRIPSLQSPSPGICSKLTVEVIDPIIIDNVSELSSNPQTNEPGTYLQASAGSFPTDIDYDGGEVATVNSSGVIEATTKTYVGILSTYQKTEGTVQKSFSYIKISQSLGGTSSHKIALRPVKIKGNLIDSRKLYNYNPYPLYVIAKLMDNAAINNITIKETIGEFQRTITPIWYTSNNTQITNANGNADITGLESTNFQQISKSSSALIDVQNKQQLRPYVERDTFYVGENSTSSVDLKKVFGTDRRVVTPDNNNLEATFIIAKKISGAGTGTIQASLNFKEQ